MNKKNMVHQGFVVLSDVWVTPSFSLCFTRPIWRLVANPENMRIPKVQKEPVLFGCLFAAMGEVHGL